MVGRVSEAEPTADAVWLFDAWWPFVKERDWCGEFEADKE
jgi:hypothetical protein